MMDVSIWSCIDVPSPRLHKVIVTAALMDLMDRIYINKWPFVRHFHLPLIEDQLNRFRI